MIELDETIRQDKISKMRLELNARATFFTVEAILVAIAAFLWSVIDSAADKTYWVIFIAIIVIVVFINHIRVQKNINALFPNLK